MIKEIPNGKAAGPDGIKGELLKYGGDYLTLILHSFLNNMLRLGKIPDELNKSIIIPIFKNGSKDD